MHFGRAWDREEAVGRPAPEGVQASATRLSGISRRFKGSKVMKKSACVAALFLASTNISSLADNSDRQMKVDWQAKEAGEKAKKQAKSNKHPRAKGKKQKK